MPNQKYDIRVEENGTWTVYDTETDLPAVAKGVPQVNMDIEDAHDLVDLLNRIAGEAEAATKQ